MAGRNTATLDRQDESLASLFAGFADELTRLVDAKLEPFKAELKHGPRAYAVRIGLVVIGMVVATMGHALLNVAIAFLIEDSSRF